MIIYAVIENGIVINTVVWDGDSDWAPPNGANLVEVDTEVTLVGVGFSYAGGEFKVPEVASDVD